MAQAAETDHRNEDKKNLRKVCSFNHFTQLIIKGSKTMQSLIPSAYKQSNPSVLLSNEEQLIDWLTQNLRKFLGLENVDEIAHYLLDEIDTEQDLRSYLTVT